MRNLVGQTFNQWTVVEKDISRNSQDRYIVQCSCGIKRSGLGQHLLSGKSTKCGKCAGLNKKRDPAKRALTQLRSIYIYGARKRGLDWGLRDDQFFTLVNSNCTYCGCKPNVRIGYATYNRIPTSHGLNGIDRVNSDKGYTPDNCVPCCTMCNKMKGVLNVEDFINQCNAIVRMRSISSNS